MKQRRVDNDWAWTALARLERSSDEVTNAIRMPGLFGLMSARKLDWPHRMCNARDDIKQGAQQLRDVLEARKG